MSAVIVVESTSVTVVKDVKVDTVVLTVVGAAVWVEVIVVPVLTVIVMLLVTGARETVTELVTSGTG